jgi:hypothetical protein
VPRVSPRTHIHMLRPRRGLCTCPHPHPIPAWCVHPARVLTRSGGARRAVGAAGHRPGAGRGAGGGRHGRSERPAPRRQRLCGPARPAPSFIPSAGGGPGSPPDICISAARLPPRRGLGDLRPARCGAGRTGVAVPAGLPEATTCAGWAAGGAGEQVPVLQPRDLAAPPAREDDFNEAETGKDSERGTPSPSRCPRCCLPVPGPYPIVTRRVPGESPGRVFPKPVRERQC